MDGILDELLRLESVPDSAVVATLGDSDRARVGQRIFVIGAPYGLSPTLTVGHISARHLPGTSRGPFSLGEFFQADAAIHRGNSGGPMFNMNGEVIGVVSHIVSLSGGSEGLGFVVTANAAMDTLTIAVHQRADGAARLVDLRVTERQEPLWTRTLTATAADCETLLR